MLVNRMVKRKLHRKGQENRHVIITVITVSIVIILALFLLLGRQFVGQAISTQTAPVLEVGKVGLNPSTAEFDPDTGDIFTLNVEANLDQLQLKHYEVTISYPSDRVIIVSNGVTITAPFSNTGFDNLFPVITPNPNNFGVLKVTDSAMLSDEYLTGSNQRLFSVKFAVLSSEDTSPISITVQNADLLDQDGNKLNNDDFVNSEISIIVPPVEICDNSIDDDNNGLTDCSDNACTGVSGCAGTSCQSDNECASGYYCKLGLFNQNGFCTESVEPALLADGNNCAVGTDCSSNNCAAPYSGVSASPICCSANRCYDGEQCVLDKSLLTLLDGRTLLCNAGTWAADDDGDGVRNQEDNCPAISNPNQADVDGDSIGDACEINLLATGTSCTSNDQCESNSCTTANQGGSFCCPTDQCYSSISNSCVTDGSFIYSQNSPTLICDAGNWLTDSDADTIPDIVDADIDGDGIANTNELNNPSVGYGETANVDVDNDGLTNDYDLDSDNDGFSDHQESFEGPNSNPYDALSVPGDYDGDGIPDSVDNCFSVANADQLNTDGDTQGNFCDNDDDNDGVADTEDMCSYVPKLDNLIYSSGLLNGCMFGDSLGGNGCLSTEEFLTLMYYYQKVDDPNTVACVDVDEGDCLSTSEFLTLMYYYQKTDDPNTVACIIGG